jgi:hypothetical protein
LGDALGDAAGDALTTLILRAFEVSTGTLSFNPIFYRCSLLLLFSRTNKFLEYLE